MEHHLGLGASLKRKLSHAGLRSGSAKRRSLGPVIQLEGFPTNPSFRSIVNAPLTYERFTWVSNHQKVRLQRKPGVSARLPHAQHPARYSAFLSRFCEVASSPQHEQMNKLQVCFVLCDNLR